VRSKYASVGGVAVNYFHTGSSTLPAVVPALDRGELLLFLHGAGSNAHTWRQQLEHFEPAHAAVAFDFPGHGRSGSTEGLPSIAAYADFTLAFADALRLRPFVIVGRAMGGAIALTLALAHPTRVRALVLVATPPRFEIPADSLETWRTVMMGRATQPFSPALFSPKTDFAVMREAWMEQVKTDPRVRYFDLLACNGCDFSAQLASITVPTLVITGRDDHFAPPEKAAALQQAIPGARLVVIDDAGHTLASEQPERFHAALDDFLTSLPRRA
jgi:pimeloyl-ACP methyl ester carboxylesterase